MRNVAAAVILAVFLGLASTAIAIVPALAQTPAAPNTGEIHGHVTNPTGQPQTVGSVSLSTDGGRTLWFTYAVSGTGDYSGEATPGTYTVVYRAPDTPAGKFVDSLNNIEIIVGQDVVQDVDMSRQAFIDKMPANQQRQLEDLKKANAVAMKANQVINSLNADLRVVNQDIRDGDSAPDAETKANKYGEAETLMLKDTQAKPDASVLWVQLGQAQAGLMKYEEAESSFMKALELEKMASRPNVGIQSLANTGLAKIPAHTGIVSRTNTAPPAAASMPDIAAPPPPPDAPPPTIALGQTMDQVTAGFGQPMKVAKLGPKTIFYYTDMKVTFTNGKVSNVE
jgi:hypothetical protein